MRKFTITLFLALMIMVVFGSRVYAGFIYDIDLFEISNGTTTFTDTFSDGVEPPDGPDGGLTYFVGANMSNTRESGGLLELNSEDAFITSTSSKIFIARSISILTTSGSGGYVMGMFEVNDGFASNSSFGVEIFNWSHSGPPAIEDKARMVTYTDSSGTTYASWGDHTVNSADITIALSI